MFWFSFVFIWSYKASGFSNIFGYYCEHCLLCGEDFFFLFFVLCYFVSGVCLSVYYTCLLFVYFGCAGSVGIFWRAGSYTFLCVCGSVVWSAGPVQFLFRHSVGADGGTVQIFLFLWLCCSGYGTVETVRGLVRLSSCFLQFAVSSLGGWMSVVRFLCYIFRFSLVDLWNFSRFRIL